MKVLKKITPETFCLLLFAASSLIFLGFFYTEHLQRLEQLQLFQLTIPYLTEHLSVNGGFAIWIAEFFIQFFHLPFAGAIIITLFLILLQQSAKSVLLKVSGSKELLILTFLPVAGYWMLMLADFYCFSGIVGLLIALIAASLYFTIREKKKRILAGLIFIPLVYWLSGGAYMVLTVCIVTGELAFRFTKRKQETVSLVALASFLIITFIFPFVSRQFIIRDTLFQAFVSEAYFQVRIFFPLPLIIIFTSLPVILMIHLFLSWKLSDRQNNIIGMCGSAVLLLLLGWGICHYALFDDEKEIKFENLTYKREWEEIIRIAEKERPASRKSIMAVNLALAKTGQLSSKLFSFDQDANSLFMNYERRGMTPFISAEPFYYMGLVNFAQMFAMETVESTPDARYPARSFKLLASTYIINGQYEIALKYLAPLSNTIFYRKWANECISMLYNEEKINSHQEFGELRRSRPRHDFYFNDQQLDLAMLFLMDANHDNRTAYEYLMANYLLKKNLNGFLQSIPLAEKLNYKEMPILFQEAAAYIYYASPDTPSQIKSFPVRSIVLTNLKAFGERIVNNDRAGAENMKKDFGNTYWYYLHFK